MPLPGSEPGTSPVASGHANHWAMMTITNYSIFQITCMTSHRYCHFTLHTYLKKCMFTNTTVEDYLRLVSQFWSNYKNRILISTQTLLKISIFRQRNSVEISSRVWKAGPTAGVPSRKKISSELFRKKSRNLSNNAVNFLKRETENWTGNKLI